MKNFFVDWFSTCRIIIDLSTDIPKSNQNQKSAAHVEVFAYGQVPKKNRLGVSEQ